MLTSFKNIALACVCLANFINCAASEAPKEAQEVLTYWFGENLTADRYPSEKSNIWFGGGKHIDDEIRTKFISLVEAASKEELSEWRATPRGRLALIILLDQFTRNIYRGSPLAFASDHIARKIALEGLQVGHDVELLPVERVFFYLPFEHAEDIELQKLSLRKFHEVVEVSCMEQQERFLGFEKYAQSHFDVIERFGRFPHRNQILGRESTPEEIQFLEGPNSSF